jgi:para-aminobenzoate synthetase component 1
MRIDRLGDLGEAPQLLRAIGDATTRLGLPPPAALTGQWFDALAVIAPSVAVRPVDPADVFAVRPGSDTTAVGGGFIGYLSYPDAGADERPGRIPEAAGGWTDCVLRRDRDRQWWYESLSGAAMPGWLPPRWVRRRRRAPATSTGYSPTATCTAPTCWTA